MNAPKEPITETPASEEHLYQDAPLGADQGRAEEPPRELSPAAETAEQARPPTSRRWRKFRNDPRWWTVIFTGLLCVITIIYVCFVGAQWAVMERSLTLTRDVLEQTQRAWVVVTGLEAPQLKPNEETAVKILIENVGRTPATNVTMTGSAIVSEGPPPELSRQAPRDWERSVAAIGPGYTPDMDIPIKAFPAEVIDELTAGRRFLHVLLEITYGNGFGKPGLFRLCARFRPGKGHGEFCSTYNEAK